MNNATAQEKKQAAFNWLRKYAFSDHDGAEHASTMLSELMLLRMEMLKLQNMLPELKAETKAVMRRLRDAETADVG